MARQGSNIISFDDAKRYASSRSSMRSSAETYRTTNDSRSSYSRRASSSEAFAPVDAFDDLTPFESPFAQARGGSRRASAGGSGYGSASSRPSRSSRSSLEGYSSVSRSGRISPIKPSWYDADEPDTRSSRAGARDAFADCSDASPRAAVEVFDASDAEDDESSARGSRRGKKKQRLKEKAEKMFARQFGGSDAASEAGPRAAVYKGEMGRSHKRAFAEMGGTQGAARTRRESTADGDGKAKKLRSKTASRIVIAAGCLVCILAVGLFLYPTAKQVYLESREEDRLQAEYDALLARNNQMQENIDYLQTDEGIQDAARKQLGWVKEGETAVVVEGLPDDSGEEQSGVNVQIMSGSVPAPETWYSPVLDVVFGYSDPATAQKGGQDSSSQADDAQDSSQASADGDAAASGQQQ